MTLLSFYYCITEVLFVTTPHRRTDVSTPYIMCNNLRTRVSRPQEGQPQPDLAPVPVKLYLTA